MKPLYMIFLLAALALGACSSQTLTLEEETPQHQPENPATWSPAGKVYVSENTCSGNGHDNWSAVFVFHSQTFERWETYDDSIFDKTKSPNAETFSYRLEYPQLYQVSSHTYESIYITFSDTCTFMYYDYVMKLDSSIDASIFLP